MSSIYLKSSLKSEANKKRSAIRLYTDISNMNQLSLYSKTRFPTNFSSKKTEFRFSKKKKQSKNKRNNLVRIYTYNSDSEKNEKEPIKQLDTLFGQKRMSTFEKNFYLKSRESFFYSKTQGSRRSSELESWKHKSSLRSSGHFRTKVYKEIEKFIEKRNRSRQKIREKLKLKNIQLDSVYVKQRKISKRFLRTNSPMNLNKKKKNSLDLLGLSFPRLSSRNASKENRKGSQNRRKSGEGKCRRFDDIKVNFFQKLKRKPNFNVIFWVFLKG